MVAKDDLDDLRRLSPRERLTRLREIEKKNKEEIEKAQQLMRESEREIEIQDELKDIPIPQVKAVDIQSLFTPEEKEVFRMKRFAHGPPTQEEEPAIRQKEKSLEEAVAEEAAQRELKAPPQYGAALEEAKELVSTLTDAYGTIKDLVGKAYEGKLSEEDAERLRSYAEAANKLYASGFRPEEDLTEVVHETERLLYAAKKQLKGESTLRTDYL